MAATSDIAKAAARFREAESEYVAARESLEDAVLNAGRTKLSEHTGINGERSVTYLREDVRQVDRYTGQTLTAVTRTLADIARDGA